jgi:hypothetical protein
MARFKPLTIEIAAPTTAGAALTVSDAKVVRAINTGANAVLVTIATSAGATVSTFTVAAGDTVYVDKAKTQKVFAASADVKLTSVGYPV